jgi:hypothetical protein
MKRIACILLGSLFLFACKDERIEPPGPGPNPDPGTGTGSDKQEIALNIYIPENGVSTYAGEFASANENFFDSIFIDLYQDNSLIDQVGFKRNELEIISDTVVKASYEVDNITTGNLIARVFANRRTPATISSEIVLPAGTPVTSFFMSGQDEIKRNNEGTAYIGTVHLVRNVAKLRTRVSLNSVFLPSNLNIDYDGIKIQVLHTPNNTSLFDGATPPSPAYIDCSERAVRKPPGFNSSVGGLVDSLYLYENISADQTNATQIKIVLPTRSNTEGNKTAEYTYTLNTNATGYNIKRNYIYTLDIKVRGQTLEPLITLDIEPWDDVPIDGSIHGTYLTTQSSEIVFDSNGRATIDFCSDAQAIYFDFSSFNSNNTAQLNFSASSPIKPVGIDSTNVTANLAPDGFRSGHILLDKQHCGSFGFQLEQSRFPDFPAVNFSGKICLRAGNIVKCLSFPARRTYDAHYIVGESILSGDLFTNATAQTDDNGSWLEVSSSRLYTGATNNYSNSVPTALYLHLDENLTTSIRTGSVTLTNTNTGAEKKIYVSQLPALRIGRFGYPTPSATNDDAIYSGDLYTEQLYEYTSSGPIYSESSASMISPNAIYNGSAMSWSAFDYAKYQVFDYQTATYEAINYCAQKNRISSNSTTDIQNGLKWFLPSQAQLMAMWIAYPSLDTIHSNIHKADIYWSSTDNGSYGSAQTLNFRYGNVGHYYKWVNYHVRCVRSVTPNHTPSNSMIEVVGSGADSYPVIDFSKGMPGNSYTTSSKLNTRGTEGDNVNKTLFKKLRVAKTDLLVSSSPFVTQNDAYDYCKTYTESGGTTGNWRLPTQRELYAVWILQTETESLAGLYGFTSLSSDEYYWSASYASTTWYNGAYTNAYMIWGSSTTPGESGNSPHHTITERHRARCVQEINN